MSIDWARRDARHQFHGESGDAGGGIGRDIFLVLQSAEAADQGRALFHQGQFV